MSHCCSITTMSKHFGPILYVLLFSGLGLFSYKLLINYTDIPQKIAESSNANGIIFAYLLSFNIAGFVTLKLSSWLSKQYSQNIKSRWKIVGIYAAVVIMLLLLNYGLLVLVKVVADAPQPFLFPLQTASVLVVVGFIELIVLGLLLVNRSMQDSLKYQQQVAELKEESDKARYIALQNQLNPHFLFNSLNTLVSEIDYDPRNAINFTKNLADVYRYVLQAQDKPLVSLGEELEFVQAYLFLHEVRIGGCIDYHLNIPDDSIENMVPPLTLQLLVENIIKHNSITQKKRMRIDLEIENGFVKVSNTVNLKKNSMPSGVGLKNLSNRCQLILGQDIVISSDHEIFTVKIPLLYEQA